MIREKVKQIVKNIDKFQQDKKDPYNRVVLIYKSIVNLNIYRGSEEGAFLYISCKKIELTKEEQKFIYSNLRKKFRLGKSNEEKQDEALNSISFNEEESKR